MCLPVPDPYIHIVEDCRSHVGTAAFFYLPGNESPPKSRLPVRLAALFLKMEAHMLPNDTPDLRVLNERRRELVELGRNVNNTPNNRVLTATEDSLRKRAFLTLGRRLEVAGRRLQAMA